jgi:hypothetical protein
LSPFYANYSYHPRTNWPTAEAPRNPGSELYTHWLHAVHQQAIEQLEKTRERMAKHWDASKREGPSFAEGDYIMLDGRHINTRRACKKLDAKLYGPFRILSVGKRTVKPELPPRWRIHPTFHISLIEPYRGDPHRATTDLQTIDIEADDEGWTPKAIVAAGPKDDNPAHHKFLVKWQGFSHEENTWEEFDHMFDIAPDLVRAYYRQRPHITPDERLPRERLARTGLRRSTRRQEDRRGS